jgi:hypothetical protein
VADRHVEVFVRIGDGDVLAEITCATTGFLRDTGAGWSLSPAFDHEQADLAAELVA